MKNHEKFLALYNELDEILRDYYHEQNRSNSVIQRFTNDLNKTFVPELQKIGKKLNMIRILRNNLIHDLNMNVGGLIEVTDSTIEFMEEVIDKVKHPKLAKDLMTPIEKVYFLNINKPLKVIDVMTNMRLKGHSQVPIVNNYNILQGVFSPNGLFSYLNEHHEVDLSSLTINQIIDDLKINAHFSESYIFVKKNMPESDLDDLFADSIMNNKKLIMAFVTNNGASNEPILGIIVVKDLLNYR